MNTFRIGSSGSSVLALCWLPLSFAAAALLRPGLAMAYTPAEPPTPQSCVAQCLAQDPKARDPFCLTRCASTFASRPWRERFALEFPKAKACLDREAACLRKQGRPCLLSQRSCLWRAAGLAVAPMQACWAAHPRRTKRCVGLDGKAGWSCREDARTALEACRRRALGRPLEVDQRRILAAIDEDMGQEVGSP